MNLESFPQKLKSLRFAKNLTLQQLATALGHTKATIGNLENANKQPSLRLITAIADYFDVPTDYLLGRGVFANWEQIEPHKEKIQQQITALTGIVFDQKQTGFIMQLFAALIKSIDFDDDQMTIHWNI